MFHNLGWVQFGTAQISPDSCPFHLLQWPAPPQSEKSDFTHKQDAFTEFHHQQHNVGSQHCLTLGWTNSWLRCLGVSMGAGEVRVGKMHHDSTLHAPDSIAATSTSQATRTHPEGFWAWATSSGKPAPPLPSQSATPCFVPHLEHLVSFYWWALGVREDLAPIFRNNCWMNN